MRNHSIALESLQQVLVDTGWSPDLVFLPMEEDTPVFGFYVPEADNLGAVEIVLEVLRSKLATFSICGHGWGKQLLVEGVPDEVCLKGGSFFWGTLNGWS